MPNFDAKSLRSVYGQFPTGVTIMTTCSASGEAIGMTASSFNTVSVNPPLILWSIDKHAYSLAIFRDCDFFAVNILSEEQIALSNRFAGKGEDKFNGISYDKGIGNCPLFRGSLAQLQCKKWAVYEGGDHLIVVGEVVDYTISHARPLVFSQGSYAQTIQHLDTRKVSERIGSSQAVEVFVADHLLYLLRCNYNNHHMKLYQLLEDMMGISPEMWRVYACLSDGNAMAIELLQIFVMQPEIALTDTLEAIGSDHIIMDEHNNTAQLTEKGLQLSCKLVGIAKDYEKRLAEKLGGNSLVQLKEGLRHLLKIS